VDASGHVEAILGSHQFFPSGGVNDFDSVRASKEHGPAVGAEGQIPDPALLLEAADLLSRTGVPKPDRAVLADRDQLLAVRAEGDVHAGTVGILERQNPLPGDEVPKMHLSGTRFLVDSVLHFVPSIIRAD